MFSVSIMGMFVYKEVTSNDTIISSSSRGTLLMENVVEFFSLLFSSFKNVSYVFVKVVSGEQLYETIGRIGTLGLCIFG